MVTSTANPNRSAVHPGIAGCPESRRSPRREYSSENEGEFRIHGMMAEGSAFLQNDVAQHWKDDEKGAIGVAKEWTDKFARE
jgi:hypothetical protein